MNLLQNFHLAVIEYLYRDRREVPLQMFTARHSNRKLSIVMDLSTTFTQCAPETTKLGKITQNKGHFAVQGHWRSPISVPIESSSTTSYQWLILTYLLSCTVCEILPSKCQNSLYLATSLAFKLPPTEGFPWDDLRKIFSECQKMAKVPNGVEILQKISTRWVGRTNVTDDRQTDGRDSI